MPTGYFALQFFDHFVFGEFAEDSHSCRKQISIVGNDSLVGQDGARQWVWGFNRPFSCGIAITQGYHSFIIISGIDTIGLFFDYGIDFSYWFVCFCIFFFA